MANATSSIALAGRPTAPAFLWCPSFERDYRRSGEVMKARVETAARDLHRRGLADPADGCSARLGGYDGDPQAPPASGRPNGLPRSDRPVDRRRGRAGEGHLVAGGPRPGTEPIGKAPEPPSQVRRSPPAWLRSPCPSSPARVPHAELDATLVYQRVVGRRGHAICRRSAARWCPRGS